MTIRLALNGVDVSESGSLIGVVRTVSQYPVTGQGVQQHLERLSLCSGFCRRRGAVREVPSMLVKDPDSESGYLELIFFSLHNG